ERQLVDPLAAGEEAAERPRVDDSAREEVRPGLLTLLDHGDRHVAEPLGDRGRALEQLAEPDRAGEAGRPGADDADADLDPLVDGIAGLGDRLRGRERRGVVGRLDAHDPSRARTSSASFGTILCLSATTPRSL